MKTLKIQRMEGIYAICADAEKKYYAIAQAEAYQGQITVEDDGEPEPAPSPQEQLRADVDFLAAMQGVTL